MTTTLIVIWMHIANGKTGWFKVEGLSYSQCTTMLKQVKSNTARTWRFCK